MAIGTGLYPDRRGLLGNDGAKVQPQPSCRSLVEQTQYGAALNDVVWTSAVVDHLGVVVVS